MLFVTMVTTADYDNTTKLTLTSLLWAAKETYKKLQQPFHK